jgi:hypothetical protein
MTVRASESQGEDETLETEETTGLGSGLLHVISRAKKLKRVFAAFDRKFDVSIGIVVLWRNWRINIRIAAREQCALLTCSSKFNFITNPSLAVWLRKTQEHLDRLERRRAFRMSNDT